jgi:hypothetical protein
MIARRIVTWSIVLSVLMVLAGIVAAPFHSKAPARTPYLSALDKLAAAPAYAACPLQKCQPRGHNGFVCVHASTFSECLISGSSCNTQSCTIQ